MFYYVVIYLDPDKYLGFNTDLYFYISDKWEGPRAQIYPPKRTYQVCSTLDLFEWREVFLLIHSELEPLGATQTVEPSTVYYYHCT